MTREEIQTKLDAAIAIENWWNAAIYNELLTNDDEEQSLVDCAHNIIDGSPQWIYDTLHDLFGEELEA